MGDSTNSKQRMQFSLDMRMLCVILLVVIAGMLAVWKPWSTTKTSDRTIDVTGSATIKATPDEFVFYPSYEFKDTSKDAALAALVKKNNEINAGLKTAGVKDEQIKTNVSGYQKGEYLPYTDETGKYVYSFQPAITVGDKDIAQKVEDFLVTTSPTGTVSPQSTFSESKRKELEAQARDEATKDARKKADQSAKNIGFKVGSVKTVSDGAGFSGGCGSGTICPMMATTELSTRDSVSSLQVQPGQNELSYSVSVTYFIR